MNGPLLQAGLPKSGNLWLYRILEGLLDEAGLPRRSFIRRHPIFADAREWRLSFPDQAGIDVVDLEGEGASCRISNRFRERITDLEGYLGATRHVWTHSRFEVASLRLLGRFERIVYIVRDPRDVAISMSRFAFTPYMRERYPHRRSSPEDYLEAHLTKLIKTWVQHVGGWLEASRHLPVQLVFYERLLHDRTGEVEKLARGLGIDLDRVALSRVGERVSLGRMRAASPDHVRAGRSGGWRTTLDARQMRRCAAIAGPLLEALGYPLPGDRLEDRLPEAETPVCEAAIRRALERARLTLGERLRNRIGKLHSRMKTVRVR